MATSAETTDAELQKLHDLWKQTMLEAKQYKDKVKETDDTIAHLEKKIEKIVKNHDVANCSK